MVYVVYELLSFHDQNILEDIGTFVLRREGNFHVQGSQASRGLQPLNAATKLNGIAPANFPSKFAELNHIHSASNSSAGF